jgi:hypothetical protein
MACAAIRTGVAISHGWDQYCEDAQPAEPLSLPRPSSPNEAVVLVSNGTFSDECSLLRLAALAHSSGRPLILLHSAPLGLSVDDGRRVTRELSTRIEVLQRRIPGLPAVEIVQQQLDTLEHLK